MQWEKSRNYNRNQNINKILSRQKLRRSKVQSCDCPCREQILQWRTPITPATTSHRTAIWSARFREGELLGELMGGAFPHTTTATTTLKMSSQLAWGKLFEFNYSPFRHQTQSTILRQLDPEYVRKKQIIELDHHASPRSESFSPLQSNKIQNPRSWQSINQRRVNRYQIWRSASFAFEVTVS